MAQTHQTTEPVYIGLNYSDDQIRNYMSEAGVSYGFFTVKMGDREATQFYSATKTTSPIQSKERYDMITSLLLMKRRWLRLI